QRGTRLLLAAREYLAPLLVERGHQLLGFGREWRRMGLVARGVDQASRDLARFALVELVHRDRPAQARADRVQHSWAGARQLVLGRRGRARAGESAQHQGKRGDRSLEHGPFSWLRGPNVAEARGLRQANS